MVRSMYSDGGILVGSGIRAALRRALSEMVNLGKIAQSSTIGVSSDSIDIKFSSLRKERGIDLAIVATNTSLRKPVLFSHVTTPDSPVIEAVAISGAHPLLYKPVILRGFKQEKVLNGVFADGGITLNLPLHIFDQSPRLAVGTKADLSEMKPGQLTPHMLAFELHEGNRPYEVIKGFSMPRRPGYDVLSYFLDVYEALQANANELQARGEEKEQIIPIYTGRVGTFDLHLRPSDANDEILAAAETVRHLVGLRSESR